MIPIFFTESSENRHLPSFPVEVIPYTFIPNVNLAKDDFYYPVVNDMIEICKSGRVIIFSHDCDEQGQLMSSLLYYSFLKCGADPKKMIRMPLTDNGVGYVGTFYTKEELNKLKSFYILERLFMNNNRSIGFKKIIMLKHFFYLSRVNGKHTVKNINPDGTNTITEVTKKLLGEL